MGQETTLSPRWLRWARVPFALAMVAVLFTVLITGASDIVWSQGLWRRLAIAAAVGLIGLLAAAMSWASVIGTSIGPAIATMGTTMPLRHLPLGGVGQLVGMSALAHAASAGKASLAYSTPLFLAATGGGASLVALPVVWRSDAPTWMRVVVALAVAGTVMVLTQGDRLLRRLLAKLSRVLPPGSTPLLGPVLWSTLAAASTSIAFLVLFPSSGSFLYGISGFSAAWLCGFLFVIAPAGLGVREGALVALWPELEPATVIAAAIVHRFSTLIAEALLFLVALRLARHVTTAGPAPDDKLTFGPSNGGDGGR